MIKNKNKGFVALFTVLITSVILAMSVGIGSIALKEIVLSSASTDGSLAFYAADSGIECALYWEGIGPPNDLITPATRCNGNIPSGSFLDPISDFEASEVYVFDMSFGENNELCANITIKRQVTPGLGYNTLIESKGSNTQCGETNPKRVERSIRVTY